MSPMTNALISYWLRLPAESAAARRRSLEAVRDRVCAGLEVRSALLPYALGDADEGVVAAATRAYVASAATAREHEAALADAVEWVRRGLALNRGAVFGALLALEDERACVCLVPLRLGLSANEVETACRAQGTVPGPLAARFLQDWLDLVADGPLPRERGALLAAVEGGRAARAA